MSPVVLKVIDESSNHHVPVGSESHFKVIIVSDQFEKISLINRHRKINELMQSEFDKGMHALSINAYTIEQWGEKQGKLQSSPECLDGFKNTINSSIAD